MAQNIKKLVQQLSLEEKTRLCGGEDWWHTRAVEGSGIPAVMFSDGPHGLRKQPQHSDHLGINESIKAVCFPTACAFTSSFDRSLIRALGEALGEECQAEDIAVLLGPAVNIKRSPLCGRNFEYMSEDPYLVGEIAAAYINGVQSKHVGTSLKHYAANNQEFRRTTVSAEIDERTLREIYLAGFEAAVKKSQPWTLMCSYNRLNGLHASENPKLLTEILRNEWGFEGFVMSDWFAVNNRAAALKAGLDLEMPYSLGHNDRALFEAVQSGVVPEVLLNIACERILTKVFEYADNRIKAEFDRDKHHALAAQIEKESAVLLKNEVVGGGPLLPLKKDAKIAFIGEYAENPRFQGGGSSHINPHKVSSALEAAKAAGISGISYAKGFPGDSDTAVEEDIAAAVAAAKAADAAVIFAGLPDVFESEGYDRSHIRMPDCQNVLIAAVAEVQPNTVVVLHNGSPVEMPWLDKVPGVLEMYLGGQAVGEAAVSILFGDTNPSGKLAESFPVSLEDNPSHLNFPGDGTTALYREGVFVGYRYYDYKKTKVLFPFGHGLSYTAFTYTNLRLSKTSITDTERLTVTVDVTNTGKIAGKEIVQLYVADKTGTTGRPIRELKGFEKIDLAPGETKTASFTLDKRSFAYYHTGLPGWYCAPGDYEISVAASSRDIRLSARVTLSTGVLLPFHVDLNTTITALLADPRTRDLAQKEIIEKLGGNAKEESGTPAASREEIETRQRHFREFMESPLRYIYMCTPIPYEEIVKLIGRFNGLTN
ncbi:MAG: glycoside hydrolase family 3 C-terminal domain-containing protein [Treponema sp.]|jgi:beta-glucosidase|nr:glycoside hydrolase family 3 C-terminal domain-containing protein [Treponema sp.]